MQQQSQAAGAYAAAVRPIAASTVIHTDLDDLDADMSSMPAPAGDLPIYYAMPRRGTKFPVVLVVQEIFGVHEYIRDVCRRLAKLGYFAIAPELNARQGDVSNMQDSNEIFSKVISKIPDAQVMSDLDAAAEYAAGTGKCDTARLGLTGFCWGGRIAWLYAAHSNRLKAAVAWYGRLAGDNNELHPRNPVDVAAQLQCPVLGLYGAQDQSIPETTIERMRHAISAAKKNAEIVVYPEAGHGFHADYRPLYNKSAAEDGWLRMLRWFEQYGVA